MPPKPAPSGSHASNATELSFPDVLLLASSSGLGGAGLNYAFLTVSASSQRSTSKDDASATDDETTSSASYSSQLAPMIPTSRLVMDRDGRIVHVPQPIWNQVLAAVTDARRAMLRDGLGGTWSQATEMSCPTDHFFDLAPEEGQSGLICFRLTAHMTERVVGKAAFGAGEILHYPLDGQEPRVVEGIPTVLLKLQWTCDTIMQQLLPVRAKIYLHDYERDAFEIDLETRNTINAMCSAVRMHAAVLLPGEDDEL
ncbi:hypothetical protein MIND_00582300 [Mycena indigotica]|uniref:Uncharacterized protein n=1 Tax=Mycena indigotica TaxID=2126181 RepID=A0A8H6SQ91_9AGAR|nr:uncharacterized protein MIND_00582300 [Mycena indigotica]KAF7303531.1 hypothetical protein MIND_00582300 [Mycena indigotica]